MFEMHQIYNNINVPEAIYIGPKGGKTDKLKLPLLKQALEVSRFGLIISNAAEDFNVTIVLPDYNSNRRAAGKPIADFFLT